MSTVHTHTVFVNNRKLTSGDQIRMRMVFENLTGLYIPGALSHGRYLDTLNRIHKRTLAVGDWVDLRETDSGRVIEQGLIGQQCNNQTVLQQVGTR